VSDRAVRYTYQAGSAIQEAVSRKQAAVIDLQNLCRLLSAYGF
jgi:hypothetical protein